MWCEYAVRRRLGSIALPLRALSMPPRALRSRRGGEAERSISTAGCEGAVRSGSSVHPLPAPCCQHVPCDPMRGRRRGQLRPIWRERREPLPSCACPRHCLTLPPPAESPLLLFCLLVPTRLAFSLRTLNLRQALAQRLQAGGGSLPIRRPVFLPDLGRGSPFSPTLLFLPILTLP